MVALKYQWAYYYRYYEFSKTNIHAREIIDNRFHGLATLILDFTILLSVLQTVFMRTSLWHLDAFLLQLRITQEIAPSNHPSP